MEYIAFSLYMMFELPSGNWSTRTDESSARSSSPFVSVTDVGSQDAGNVPGSAMLENLTMWGNSSLVVPTFFVMPKATITFLYGLTLLAIVFAGQFVSVAANPVPPQNMGASTWLLAIKMPLKTPPVQRSSTPPVGALVGVMLLRVVPSSA